MSFIGAGPGAPDLLTLRGARAIAAADIVVFGANLVMGEVVSENARPDAEVIAWPPASMDEILAAYETAAADDLAIARVVGGDPAIYVDMSEEIDRAGELGMDWQIVPGVGSLSAAAAAVGRELVTARTDQVLVLASARADLEAVARPGAVAALYMSGEEGDEVQRRLLAVGHPAHTPCSIVNRASWPDESLVACRLDELANHLSDSRFARQTIVVVGISCVYNVRHG